MSPEHTLHHLITSPAVDDVRLEDLLPEPMCELLFRAVIDAGADVALLAPELSACRALAYRYSLPSGLVGAYVPVIGVATGFHVGTGASESSMASARLASWASVIW